MCTIVSRCSTTAKGSSVPHIASRGITWMPTIPRDDYVFSSCQTWATCLRSSAPTHLHSYAPTQLRTHTALHLHTYIAIPVHNLHSCSQPPAAAALLLEVCTPQCPRAGSRRLHIHRPSCTRGSRRSDSHSKPHGVGVVCCAVLCWWGWGEVGLG